MTINFSAIAQYTSCSVSPNKCITFSLLWDMYRECQVPPLLQVSILPQSSSVNTCMRLGKWRKSGTVIRTSRRTSMTIAFFFRPTMRKRVLYACLSALGIEMPAYQNATFEELLKLAAKHDVLPKGYGD